ncbi:hypothetical protein BpHYR1_021511 [Brachionus plicatilis]|uniref:Uncharacterized protein n=1 Tax=Brachionus plicatilis TaxID=10195 RepID=A0A3M7T1X1_BRAPC|nr:hypothetical protein BpHYR1_021511 [Brachionus plicatilis]
MEFFKNNVQSKVYEPISLNELFSALKKSKGEAASGPDLIHNLILVEEYKAGFESRYIEYPTPLFIFFKINGMSIQIVTSVSVLIDNRANVPNQIAQVILICRQKKWFVWYIYGRYVRFSVLYGHLNGQLHVSLGRRQMIQVKALRGPAALLAESHIKIELVIQIVFHHRGRCACTEWNNNCRSIRTGCLLTLHCCSPIWNKIRVFLCMAPKFCPDRARAQASR